MRVAGLFPQSTVMLGGVPATLWAEMIFNYGKQPSGTPANVYFAQMPQDQLVIPALPECPIYIHPGAS